MSISPATEDRDMDVSPTVSLRFDVIKLRAAQIHRIALDEVTDQLLAEMFGITREQVNRLKLGKNRPGFKTLTAISKALDLPMDAFVETAGE